MIWALIRKDARLLRNYLRSAVVVTGCSYLVTAIVIHRESPSDASTPWGIAMTLLVLALGSNLGFLSTAFMAALMAGSVFTLERSDRSAEFLACLPPTRKQNLVSKLSVVLVPIGLMIFVHILTNIAAHQVSTYVPAGSYLRNGLLFATGILTYVSIIIATLGGALAVSALLKSNGVPVLCGLFNPFLVLGVVLILGYVLDIPAEGDAFANRYATSAFVIGGAFAVMGCYWYLTRSST